MIQIKKRIMNLKLFKFILPFVDFFSIYIYYNMGRRVKERSHKRRKVSLTRKRRKTGKSRYSKRSHKRKMMGGSGARRADGAPMTHTVDQTWVQRDDPAALRAKQERAGREARDKMKAAIKIYNDIIMREPVPNTLEELRELFREMSSVTDGDIGQILFQTKTDCGWF